MIKEARIICEIFEDFKETELSEWEYIFATGFTMFFDRGFIVTNIQDDVCFVNSATINDEPFNRKMLLYLRELGTKYHNAVVSSTVNNAKSLINRGFTYDKERNLYYRGDVDLSNLIEFRRE